MSKKIDNETIKDVIQLLQGLDITLREYRGKFCKLETSLNSILEENIKSFEKLQKRQEKEEKSK